MNEDRRSPSFKDCSLDLNMAIVHNLAHPLIQAAAEMRNSVEGVQLFGHSALFPLTTISAYQHHWS